MKNNNSHQEHRAYSEPCALTQPDSAPSSAVQLALGTQRSTSWGKFLLPFSASLLVMSQAYGFGMQELKVNSYLGQPLRATLPLNVSAAERVNSNCFQVVNSRGSTDLPTISKANTRLVQSGGQYSLNISSTSGVTEPMTEITVATNCATLPRMERTFMVMLDPESQATSARRNTATPRREEYLSSNTSAITYQQPTYRQPAYTRPRFVAPSSPIQQSTSHTVTFGESLTEIAARVSGRQEGSMWRMAAAIHAANPNAFYNGDPDHLEVGASLNIPSVSNGFNLSEAQAQQTLSNPAYRSIASNSSFAVQTPTASNVSNADLSASDLLTVSDLNVITADSNAPANETQSSSIPTSSGELVAVSESLPTLTLSSSLSSVSMQRVQARASGQILKEFIPDNSDLFGTPDEDKEIVKEAVLTASRESETNTTPAVTTVSAPTSSPESDSGFSFTSLFAWLFGLLALGLAAWKLLLPRIQKHLRIWNISRHRAHIKKRRYRDRQNERRRMLDETGSVRTMPAAVAAKIATAAKSTPAAASSSTSNTGLFEAPSWAKRDNSSEQTGSQKPTAPGPLPLELDDIHSTGVMKQIRLDDNTKVDLGEKSSSGPRKATVAKSVYDVEMIDDTGELASLTTAFPELEAELNARIGEDNMDDMRDSLDTRLTEALESIDIDFDESELGATRISTAEVQTGIDVDFDAVDLIGATQTLQVNTSALDLDLPGLLDDSQSLDFEDIASGEEDFSKTNVFNEEIFSAEKIDISDLSDTFSTEGISADDSTRVAEVLIDEDGLRPEDFGVSSEELSTERSDYTYLEDDASIVTESLNIDFDELEELGLGDDNIIPFDPSKKKRSA